MSNKLKTLEAKLTLQQRKAALLLVENEIIEDGPKKSQDKMAEEIGVDRSTLYRWRTQNPAFIEYMNTIADDMLSSHRAEAYAQLLKLIRGSQPSVKALDLFFKRFGLLTEKQITETIDGNSSRSNDDLEKELAELDDLLDDD